jgi:FKBP-type peptidyl-prolyl cis-trans isomerase FkpA
MDKGRSIWTVAIASLALAASSSFAQEAKPADPSKSGNASIAGATAKAITGPWSEGGWPPREPMPVIADAEIAAAYQLLTGSFASDPVAGGGVGAVTDIPALVYNAARIDVTGLDNAVYFEIGRADGFWRPFRQGVFHLYRQGRNLRLRMFDFGGMPTFNDAVIGLWLAPEVFPPLAVANLVPKADITLTKTGDRYEGKTAARVPTTVQGAIEFEASIGFGPGQITLWDRGFDAAGTQVFGQPEGKSIVFKTAAPKAKVTRTAKDVVAIDMVPPGEGPVATADAENRIAVHYTGWLQSDGWKFASSKDPRWDGTPPEPQVFSLKARLLSGWSEGIPGMTKGGIRRLIMPSGMAFHSTGSQPWRVPPNTHLIFEVECLWVEDKPPAPPPDAPAKEEGKPAEGGGANPANAAPPK